MTEKATDRDKAVVKVVSEIEKAFGKGAIMRLGDPAALEPVAVIPTGSLALDESLGVGGYPRGRVVEIYGPESSGKTTLALHAIAQVQEQFVLLGPVFQEACAAFRFRKQSEIVDITERDRRWLADRLGMDDNSPSSFMRVCATNEASNVSSRSIIRVSPRISKWPCCSIARMPSSFTLPATMPEKARRKLAARRWRS